MVPSVTAALREMTVKYFGFKPVVIEAGVKTGMPILTENPREVGADRIANAVGGDDLYVHRDDLPPTDPDAELVEKMARANFELAWPGCDWATWADHTKDRYRTRASAVLAVVREHEATR